MRHPTQGRRWQGSWPVPWAGGAGCFEPFPRSQPARPPYIAASRLGLCSVPPRSRPPVGRGLGLPTVLPEEALCRLPKGCEAPCDPNLIQSQRASSIDVHRVAPGCRCAKAGEHLLAARDTAPESLLPFPPGWMLLALMEENPGGQSLPQILVWAPNMLPTPTSVTKPSSFLDPGFGTWPHC